jgi:hypothetical protein
MSHREEFQGHLLSVHLIRCSNRMCKKNSTYVESRTQALPAARGARLINTTSGERDNMASRCMAFWSQSSELVSKSTYNSQYRPIFVSDNQGKYNLRGIRAISMEESE